MESTHLVQSVQSGYPRQGHDDDSRWPTQVYHSTGQTCDMRDNIVMINNKTGGRQDYKSFTHLALQPPP